MKFTKKNTALTACFMVAATLLAKVCGMLRDILIAAMYGTSTNEAIAFSGASRIPLLFFDIALGSAVTSAFIPIFNEYLEKDGKKRAMEFSNMFINLIALVTVTLSAVGMIFSKQIVNIIAGGYDEAKIRLMSSLVVIIFPTIVFTGLAYCFVGILQSLGEFYIPSVISLVSNGFLILYLVIFKDRFGVHGVAAAMLIAWSTQLFVQIPSLVKKGYRYKPVLSFKDDGIKKVCVLALPIILSTWVQPINNLINIRLASGLADSGSVTALDYANKLYIILVGVFTFSITNLIFPSLSRASTEGDGQKFADITRTAVKYVILIITPVMVGFIILATPIIRLLYERGRFDAHSTALTATALVFYSLGMLGYAVQEICNKAFYSMHDGKTPMFVSVCGITLNIVLSILLVWGYDCTHWALAFSASVAANLMGIVIFALLCRRAKGVANAELLIHFVKIIISSAVMAAAAVFAYKFTANYSKIVCVAVPTVCGAVVYGICCIVLRVGELTDILSAVFKKIKGGA